MIIRKETFEIINNEVVKQIKGITVNGTHMEIRYKHGWLNVFASNNPDTGMKSIHCEKVDVEMSIKDMIDKFDIIFE